jgi:DNA polymerase-3 subunit delta
LAKQETRDVLGDIASGDVAPVYCLHGNERFLVDRCLAVIRKAVLGSESAAPTGFDHDVFDLKETPLPQVLGAARTLPMFSKRRLVIAEGIDDVKAAELEPLVKYVADPNPRGCLVLVGGEAKRRGLDIEPSAMQALAEFAGPDLGRVAQAMEQVSLFAGGRIKRAHVEELIPESRERGVFELTKAIGIGDVRLALDLVSNMLRNREPALKIQFMLLRQLRQIWRAKELSAASVPRGEIAAKVGIAPFFLDDILIPAGRMSAVALKRSFMHLYQADRSLKSSRVDPDVQMLRLVRQLAEESSPRR